MLAEGTISPSDLDIIKHVEKVEDAVEIIKNANNSLNGNNNKKDL